MVLLLAWILGVVLIGKSCADDPEKIVGGTTVWGREFPFIVSLRANGHHFCGGALISRQHVLTAAHCLVDLKPSPKLQISVVTGSNYIASGGQTHLVSKYFYHPRYNGIENTQWHNDIGVIKLRGPVQFNRDQNMVQLPTRNPPAQVLATVSGWGTSSAEETSGTEGLQKANLQIIPNDVCQEYFNVEIFNGMICTFKGENYGTCSGDSGGPLIFNNKIIGVVSGGIPCALGYPDIFTNVYMYLDYIHAWLEA